MVQCQFRWTPANQWAPCILWMVIRINQRIKWSKIIKRCERLVYICLVFFFFALLYKDKDKLSDHMWQWSGYEILLGLNLHITKYFKYENSIIKRRGDITERHLIPCFKHCCINSVYLCLGPGLFYVLMPKIALVWHVGSSFLRKLNDYKTTKATVDNFVRKSLTV